MTMPQPPKSQSGAPRRIGLHRYSVAEFLIALVVVLIARLVALYSSEKLQSGTQKH
jgi:hypothetical protein